MDDGFRGLTLHNTMTRRKEEFRPLDWQDDSLEDAEKRVRMYVCGPTVYDYAHIGNARPVIVFDALFRLLRHLYGEDRVTYVRNITDVDDKINARAARDYPELPLNEAIAKVTAATAEQFHLDVAALGCLPPSAEPRATEFVTGHADGHDMVSMIATLIEKGHAYEAGGEVLFDISSMPDYGRLSHRNLDEQQAGARVAVDAHKRNPGDFVLWKLSGENEPGWEAPWGQDAWTAAGRTGTPRGRPGWHIECSVMSEAYLGKTFDIHGGGLDLIFPHHENEIAQSRCAHGSEMMAQVWMHNGYLQVEGRKMSKSEGNFVTIHDLLNTDKFGGRKWPGEVLRLAMLMTHYREPIDFSVRRLEEAEALLSRWYRMLSEHPGLIPSEPREVMISALLNDLSTRNAVDEVYGMFTSAQAGLLEVGVTELGWDFYEPADAAIALASAQFLGLLLQNPEDWLRTGSEIDEATIRDIIATRLGFIREKNWAEADRIRDEFLAKGIQLKDGKDPQTGERITTWEVKR